MNRYYFILRVSYIHFAFYSTPKDNNIIIIFGKIVKNIMVFLHKRITRKNTNKKVNVDQKKFNDHNKKTKITFKKK